jgi:hypothetical protein
MTQMIADGFKQESMSPDFCFDLCLPAVALAKEGVLLPALRSSLSNGAKEGVFVVKAWFPKSELLITNSEVAFPAPTPVT